MNVLELLDKEIKGKDWSEETKSRYLYIRSGQLFSYDPRFFYANNFLKKEILEQVPELTAIFARLAGTIDTATMQQLNAKSDNELLEPAVVAKQFLETHHYFEGGTENE